MAGRCLLLYLSKENFHVATKCRSMAKCEIKAVKHEKSEFVNIEFTVFPYHEVYLYTATESMYQFRKYHNGTQS